MSEQTNPVVILGAYQSGTSVLAGCLRLLGVNLGPSLGAADGSEEARDYPENSSIILIHDILLRDLNCRWDMIGTLPENWLQSRAAANAREKIENLIEREFASSAPWVISDPRLCKFLPLWLDIFSEKGLTPRIVFMVRHPYEVAVSLQNRHGFDLLKGHLLWLSSNRQALSRLREYDHAIITYDRLLADPVSCLETIGRELNLSFPIGLADGYQDLIAYIRPELKHAHNSHADTGEKGKNIFAHYAWLYGQFRLNETRHLASPAQTQASDEAVFSAKTAVQNLAVFPLVPKAPKAQKTAVDTSHAAEMFDNLLGLIRSYEQAELNTEIKRQRLLLEADHQEPMLYAQICLPSADNDQNMHPSENTKKILLAPEEWQKISMEINNPDVLRQNRLRFDPLNTRGMIRIQSLALINAATDQAVWSAPDSAGFDQCSVEGQALVLDRQEGLVMCATGNTPRIFLPAFPDLPDAPLRFEVWLKAGRNLDQITDLWTQKDQTIKKLKTEIEATQKQKDELARQTEQSKTEWEQEKQALREKLTEKERMIQVREEKKKTLEAEKQNFQQDLQQLEAKLAKKESVIQKQAELEAEKQSLEQYLQEKEEHKQQLAIEVEEKAQEAEENARKAKSRAEEVTRLQEKIARQDEALAGNEQELKHIRDKVTDRESDLERLQQELQNLQDKLDNQEDLTRQYFTELSKSESQLVHVQDRLAATEERADTAELQNKENGKLISQLRRDYQALISSARWRWGNFLVRLIEILLFRKKQPLAVDHMNETLNRLEQKGHTAEKFNIPLAAPSPFHDSESIKMLNNWLRQLNNDYELLKNSMRWKLGNALIRFLELLAFRRKKTMAIDHLGQIFQEYQDESAGSRVQNTKKLKSWLRQAKNDFHAIRNSVRWRTGNRLVSIIDLLTFRWKKKTAMDHALKISAAYEDWAKNN